MENNTVSLKRLVIQSIPEIWIYQIITQIVLTAGLFLVEKLATALLNTRVAAFTSGNLSALLSW